MSDEPVTRDEIRAMRRSYGDAGLETLPNNPFEAFALWLKQAHENTVIVEANAMVLSTLSSDSQINTRTVLLKDISNGGFTFFTNYESRKAHAIELNPHVSLLFPWYAMERQVIITARAEKVPRGESEEYFASRPWSSQIGAWASNQSQKLQSTQDLEKRVKELESRFPNEVPRPDFWGGYSLKPIYFEFWQGRSGRLHDRIIYTIEGGEWVTKRLQP